MKYSPEIYARAFMETVYSAPKEKQEKLLLRFLEAIKKNGDLPQIKRIFRAIQKAVVKKNGGRIINLELAHNISQELLAKLRNNFSPKDCLEIYFHPELIAGVRMLFDEEIELDLTIRKKLKKLFNDL
jgi:F0F1-type ATP synthase delta subunit